MTFLSIYKKYSAGFILFAALLFFSLSCINSCGNNGVTGRDDKNKKAVPVTIASAITKDVPVLIKAIGNVHAFSNVAVKSQVEGEIVRVHFREGQEVKAGDLLFSIDSRIYRTQLGQAEANIARDMARLGNAKKQLERYGSIVKKGITEEQYDQLASTAAALEADIRAGRAAMENARLKVEFCSIKSPISGIAGSLRLHKGNIVKANDSDKPLMIINQIQPVYAAFSVPERYLPEIRKNMAIGRLEVTVSVPGDESAFIKGHLEFMENSVDTSTGTIQLMAIFKNEDMMLWPGQFVNLDLGLSTKTGQIVVPSRSVMSGQRGWSVMVVKNDSSIEYRDVLTGISFDGETVITKGLKTGEKVVTDGQMKLAPGALVKVVKSGEDI